MVDFVISRGSITAVVLGNGQRIECGAVVLTTGTFLRGLIHIGERRFAAGRMNEKASLGLVRDIRPRWLHARSAEDRYAAAA